MIVGWFGGQHEAGLIAGQEEDEQRQTIIV